MEAPRLKELIECLRWALDDNDIFDFDPQDPAHCERALIQKLHEELSVHVPRQDQRYAAALLYLVRNAGRMSRTEWCTLTEMILGGREQLPDLVWSFPFRMAPRRCAPEAPVAGHIDEGDPEDAPPHGTVQRYTSRVYQCRCAECRRAYAAYRREGKAKSDVLK